MYGTVTRFHRLLGPAAVALIACAANPPPRPQTTSSSLGMADTIAREQDIPRCDAIEQCLEFDWETSLDAAMQRGQEEGKPVLIVFSARQQEAGDDHEF